LDLGKFKVPKEDIGDLFTMQSSNSQPPANGIELDSQDTGSSPKPQPLGQELQTHEDSLLGAAKIKEGGTSTAGEGFPTGSTEKEVCFACASSSIGTIGDHIAQTFLSEMLALGIGAGDVQIFRLWSTFLLCSLSHPLLLFKERIA